MKKKAEDDLQRDAELQAEKALKARLQAEEMQLANQKLKQLKLTLELEEEKEEEKRKSDLKKKVRFPLFLLLFHLGFDGRSAVDVDGGWRTAIDDGWTPLCRCRRRAVLLPAPEHPEHPGRLPPHRRRTAAAPRAPSHHSSSLSPPRRRIWPWRAKRWRSCGSRRSRRRVRR